MSTKIALVDILSGAPGNKIRRGEKAIPENRHIGSKKSEDQDSVDNVCVCVCVQNRFSWYSLPIGSCEVYRYLLSLGVGTKSEVLGTLRIETNCLLIKIDNHCEVRSRFL